MVLCVYKLIVNKKKLAQNGAAMSNKDNSQVFLALLKVNNNKKTFMLWPLQFKVKYLTIKSVKQSSTTVDIWLVYS